MGAVFQPDRLVLARRRRGYNKTTLAQRAGVTPQTVTAYEQSERYPQRAGAERLALALDVPVAFLYADPADAVPLDAASFRSLARMTAAQRDAALAAGTLAVELNDWIEERFHLPANQVPDLDPGIITPEGAASHVRGEWGLGNAPIGNVLQEVESRGVRAFALAAECREVDAFSFWREETSTPFVFLGTHKTPERQVFDLAHELGHLVLHRDHAAPRGRQEEREADMFASCFLMPSSDVIAAAPRLPSFRDLVRAKRRWRVSAAALNFRMHQLGLITDWHYHTLCMEISRIGRNIELDSIPREQSQVLGKVIQALRAEGITRADIAASLHLYQRDIDALLGRLVVSVMEGGREEAALHPPPQLRVLGG